MQAQYEWTPEFQHLVLRAALRGDFLAARIPLDPDLFGAGPKGGISPAQDIARVITSFITEKRRPPTREEFLQLVAEVSVNRPERRAILEDTVVQIMTVELPDDPSFIFDRVLPALQARKMEKAAFEAMPLLSSGDPLRIAEAQEILRRALEPIVPIGSAGPAELQTFGRALRSIGATREWVVDRMFAVGSLSQLVAVPGVGKSYFIAELARDVALGEPFLGRKTKQGTVVMFLFEGANTTVPLMARLGVDTDDPYAEDVMVWNADGPEGKTNPLQWMVRALGERKPTLLIVDTMAGLLKMSGNSSNGGYEEAVNKLGPILTWSGANRVHVLMTHHAGKASLLQTGGDNITSGIGTIGFGATPDTVLTYRKMNREPGAPRVLSGAKHRVGDLATDLPDTVIEIDPTSRRLFASGSKVEIQQEISVEAIGTAMIRVVRQAMLTNPAGIRQFGEDGLIAAVDGRRQVKLEALRTLTEPGGPLEMTGTPRSKTDPLMVKLRTPEADTVWRDRFTRRAPILSADEEV